MEQLKDFLQEVEMKFPSSDPSAYTVVEQLIKPRTEVCGCSWALMCNPEGLDVKVFVTHAWAEGVKEFCRSVLATKPEGGIWICFLANPQTWSQEDLSRLLGANPFQSPFFIALRQSELVLAVRNERANLYSRLWCVFELWAAHREGKRIVTVGANPPAIDPSCSGFNASCSSEDDTKMLLGAIRMSGNEQDLNAYIGRVIFHTGAGVPAA